MTDTEQSRPTTGTGGPRASEGTVSDVELPHFPLLRENRSNDDSKRRPDQSLSVSLIKETLGEANPLRVGASLEQVMHLSSFGKRCAWVGVSGTVYEVINGRHDKLVALTGTVIRRISCGGSVTVAASAEGKLFQWGLLSIHGKSPTLQLPTPVPVSGTIASLSCGKNFVMAVSDKGKVFSWGRNDSGQLGLTHEEDQESPQEITSLSEEVVTAVRCGEAHTAALTETGEVYTWGCTENGRLGHEVYVPDDGKHQSIPRKIEEKALEGVRVVSVACGYSHTLLATSEGKVLGCGTGSMGQLGKMGGRDAKVPTPVPGLPKVKVPPQPVPEEVETGENGSDGDQNEEKEREQKEQTPPPAPLVQVFAGGNYSVCQFGNNAIYVWGSTNNSSFDKAKALPSSAVNYWIVHGICGQDDVFMVPEVHADLRQDLTPCYGNAETVKGVDREITRLKRELRNAPEVLSALRAEQAQVEEALKKYGEVCSAEELVNQKRAQLKEVDAQLRKNRAKANSLMKKNLELVDQMKNNLALSEYRRLKDEAKDLKKEVQKYKHDIQSDVDYLKGKGEAEFSLHVVLRRIEVGPREKIASLLKELTVVEHEKATSFRTTEDLRRTLQGAESVYDTVRKRLGLEPPEPPEPPAAEEGAESGGEGGEGERGEDADDATPLVAEVSDADLVQCYKEILDEMKQKQPEVETKEKETQETLEKLKTTKDELGGNVDSAHGQIFAHKNRIAALKLTLEDLAELSSNAEKRTINQKRKERRKNMDQIGSLAKLDFMRSTSPPKPLQRII